MHYATGNKRAGPMPTMEASLAAFEARIVEAQKSADALSKAFRDLKKTASTGHLVDFERAWQRSHGEPNRIRRPRQRFLLRAWDFDSKTYLEGGYIQELKQEAQAQGLTLVERDGRLYCFPLVLRIEPRELTIRIGNKRERRLRPKEIVSQLASTQKRKQRFNSAKFLDALYQAYQRIQGINWQKVENGPGSGGHFATLYTHIDDLVESLRVITPKGLIETRRLPGSGAGPSPDRLLIGSEGILGTITQAWMRLQDRPKFRAGGAVQFPDFFTAARAIRVRASSMALPDGRRTKSKHDFTDRARVDWKNQRRHHRG